MGIFDVFTGAPAKEAAANTRNYLQGVQTQGNADITQGYNSATGAVNAGTAGARTALGQGYNAATAAAGSGATGAINYINQGSTDALGRIDATGAAGSAAYSPLAELGAKYGSGTNLYLDSLGVNGQGGNQRAQAAFRPSGAYNFNLDQGLEAINRHRNAGGMLNSGNADRDAQEYGAGLASREYGGWQDRLAGLVNPELSATSGVATGRAGVAQNTGLAGAGIANSAGTSRAGIESGRGAMLADLAQRYGTAGAGLEQGAGNTLAGLATGAAGQRVGLATGIASPYANTYGQEAAAQMQGSANLWGLGQNLLKIGTGQAGSAAGGGGMSGWFGGTPAPTGGMTSAGWNPTGGGYNPNVPGGYIYPV